MSSGRWPVHALAGLTLASCFFYPLIAAADAQVFFLHWQRAHTYELLFAFLAIAVGVGVGVALELAARVVSPQRALLMHLAIVAVPVGSLGLALLRVLPQKDLLAPYAAVPVVRIAVVGAAVLLALVAFLFAPVGLAAVRGTILVLSPLSLVVVLGMWQLANVPTAPASFGRHAAGGRVGQTHHILVLLFDELSRQRLYDGRAISADLPYLAAFGTTARHYLTATSPAGETLESMPGFLTLRRYDDVDVQGDRLLEVTPEGHRVPLAIETPDNLFARARAAGFRTELFGWYYPYCRLLPNSLDRCAAYSLYNTSTVRPAFSPLDAVRTTLILWPHQFPSGLLKNPAFAEHQRRLTARIEQHASERLGPAPTFRFVHFSIPHVPFVFDREGYDPPFDPVTEREDLYARQLRYVDTVVGRMLTSLAHSEAGDRTTVVVTSDHEFRAQSRKDTWSEVPLMVRGPGQTVREEVEETVRAEDVIRALVETSRLVD